MARAIDPGPQPKPNMSGVKRIILLSLGGVLDVLKFACTMLIFVGPALLGAIVGAKTGSTILGVATVAVSGVVENASGAGEVIEIFGIVCALIVGLAGWLFFIGFFLITSPVAFAEASAQRMLVFAAGFIVSELPFIDMIPTFTPTLWSLTSTMRKNDMEKHKKWEEESEAFARIQRQNTVERIGYIQAAQAAKIQAEAANDNEEIPEETAQAA